MTGYSIRHLAERFVRNRTLRKRLPRIHGARPIWISPDARLRYIKLGSGAFDGELLDIAARFARPGDVVFDIGSNVGEFALAAAHHVGSSGAVLAVEPDSFLATLLHRTAREAGNRDVNLAVLSAAVCETTGFEKFYISARGRASNALASSGRDDLGGVRHEVLVPTATIDALAAGWGLPKLIKIDVEGAELRVLHGATHTLTKHRPILYIEVRKHEEEVRTLLSGLDYIAFDPQDRNLDAPLSKCVFDTLFVPRERLGEFR